MKKILMNILENLGGKLGKFGERKTFFSESRTFDKTDLKEFDLYKIFGGHYASFVRLKVSVAPEEVWIDMDSHKQKFREGLEANVPLLIGGSPRFRIKSVYVKPTNTTDTYYITAIANMGEILKEG